MGIAVALQAGARLGPNTSFMWLGHWEREKESTASLESAFVFRLLYSGGEIMYYH